MEIENGSRNVNFNNATIPVQISESDLDGGADWR